MMVTILDFSLWRFCGASVVTVVVYHCSVALLPIVPWADDRSSLLGRIPLRRRRVRGRLPNLRRLSASPLRIDT